MKRKKIVIFCEMILQYDLKTFLSGGGERWQLEFGKLLKKLKYDVEIYQYSNEEKTVKFDDFEIHGLGCLYDEANKKFHDITNNRNDIDGYVYMVMNLNEYGYNKTNKPKIAVSHGIWWDDIIFRNKHHDWLERFKKWLINLDHVISVDSNTLHICQAYCPKYQHKISVVPNFTDIDIFKKDKKIPNDKFRVLCPRRIHVLRGTEPFLLAAQELIKRYNDIEFTICGKGFFNDQEYYKKIVENENRINLTDTSFFKMPRLYNSHDISVIPTIGSEGTSLSAIESLSCETPIISTIVGGLSDIIHDRFNGRVCKIDYTIDSNKKITYNIDDLVEKIEWFYKNQHEIDRMGKNGRNLVECSFSKTRWDLEIIKIINNIFSMV